MSQIVLTVGGNTAALSQSINAAVNRPWNIGQLNTRGFSQPLGKITGQASEFSKSLEAANARVVAFGASALAIALVKTALDGIIGSTIQVEASMANVNSVLGLTTSQLGKFSSDLFLAASQAGASFKDAALAATEFSRQGLSAEETIKRTSSALVLARLSGISFTAAVADITAAINSFNKEALVSEDIVNRMAAVDARFAVSSADLAEGIKRVGASASDANVTFNQMLALITSVQQSTARGGAVIGNAFKTIFTRMGRPEVLQQLESIGVQTRTATGEIRPLVDILKSLAQRYDHLGPSQRSMTTELLGGVYQINILKAAMRDLGQGTSVFDGALKAAGQSSGEANRRIEELNNTVSGKLTQTMNSFIGMSSKFGSLTIAPVMKSGLDFGKWAAENLSEKVDGDGIGAKIGEGLLRGIGNILSGPGVQIATFAILKLFGRLVQFGTVAGREFFGVTTAAGRLQAIEQSTSAFLSKQPDLLEEIRAGRLTIVDAARRYTHELASQNEATLVLKRNSLDLAKILQTPPRGIGGQPIFPQVRATMATVAHGWVPNFNIMQREEAEARSLGASSGVRAHTSRGTIGGKRFVMNNQETEIPNFGQNGDSAVIPHYAGGNLPDNKYRYHVLDRDFLTMYGNRNDFNKIIKHVTDSKLVEELVTGAAGVGKTTYIKSKYPNASFIESATEALRFNKDHDKVIVTRALANPFEQHNEKEFNAARAITHITASSDVIKQFRTKRAEDENSSTAFGRKGYTHGPTSGTFLEAALNKYWKNKTTIKVTERSGNSFSMRDKTEEEKIRFQELQGVLAMNGAFTPYHIGHDELYQTILEHQAQDAAENPDAVLRKAVISVSRGEKRGSDVGLSVSEKTDLISRLHPEALVTSEIRDTRPGFKAFEAGGKAYEFGIRKDGPARSTAIFGPDRLSAKGENETEAAYQERTSFARQRLLEGWDVQPARRGNSRIAQATDIRAALSRQDSEGMGLEEAKKSLPPSIWHDLTYGSNLASLRNRSEHLRKARAKDKEFRTPSSTEWEKLGQSEGIDFSLEFPKQTYNEAAKHSLVPKTAETAGQKLAESMSQEEAYAHVRSAYGPSGLFSKNRETMLNPMHIDNKALRGIESKMSDKGGVDFALLGKAGFTFDEDKRTTVEKKSALGKLTYPPKISHALLAYHSDRVGQDFYDFNDAGMRVQYAVGRYNKEKGIAAGHPDLMKLVEANLGISTDNFAKTLNANVSPEALHDAKTNTKGFKSQIHSGAGAIFDAAFVAAFGIKAKKDRGGADFDVPAINKKLLPKILSFFDLGGMNPAEITTGDFKSEVHADGDARRSMAYKVLADSTGMPASKALSQRQKEWAEMQAEARAAGQNRAAGFIPNFGRGDVAKQRIKGLEFEDLFHKIIGKPKAKSGAPLDFPQGLLSGVDIPTRHAARINDKSAYGDLKYGLNTPSITHLMAKYLMYHRTPITKAEHLSNTGFSMLYKEGTADHNESAERPLKTLVAGNPSLLKQVSNPKMIDKRNGKLNERGRETRLSMDFLADRVLDTGFAPNFAREDSIQMFDPIYKDSKGKISVADSAGYFNPRNGKVAVSDSRKSFGNSFAHEEFGHGMFSKLSKTKGFSSRLGPLLEQAKSDPSILAALNKISPNYSSQIRSPMDLVDEAFAQSIGSKFGQVHSNDSSAGVLNKFTAPLITPRMMEHISGYMGSNSAALYKRLAADKLPADKAIAGLYNGGHIPNFAGVSVSEEPEFNETIFKSDHGTATLSKLRKSLEISDVAIKKKSQGQGHSRELYAAMFANAKEKGYSSISGVALAQNGKFPFPQMMERIRHGKETTVSTMTGEEVSLKTKEDILNYAKRASQRDVHSGLMVNTKFAAGHVPNFSTRYTREYLAKLEQRYPTSADFRKELFAEKKKEIKEKGYEHDYEFARKWGLSFKGLSTKTDGSLSTKGLPSGNEFSFDEKSGEIKIGMLYNSNNSPAGARKLLKYFMARKKLHGDNLKGINAGHVVGERVPAILQKASEMLNLPIYGKVSDDFLHKIGPDAVSKYLKDIKRDDKSKFHSFRFSPETLSGGHIPNFNAIQDAVRREHAAGLPMSSIRVDRHPSLVSSRNPSGLGVWNTVQETGLSDGMSKARSAGINPTTKGMSRMAKGHVPNFADDSSGTIGGFGMSAFLGALAFMIPELSRFGGTLKKVTAELEESKRTHAPFSQRVEAAQRVISESSSSDRYSQRAIIERAGLSHKNTPAANQEEIAKQANIRLDQINQTLRRQIANSGTPGWNTARTAVINRNQGVIDTYHAGLADKAQQEQSLIVAKQQERANAARVYNAQLGVDKEQKRGDFRQRTMTGAMVTSGVLNVVAGFEEATGMRKAIINLTKDLGFASQVIATLPGPLGYVAGGAVALYAGFNASRHWLDKSQDMEGALGILKEQVNNSSAALSEYSQSIGNLSQMYLDSSVSTQSIIDVQNKMSKSLSKLTVQERVRISSESSIEGKQRMAGVIQEEKKKSVSQSERALAFEKRREEEIDPKFFDESDLKKNIKKDADKMYYEEEYSSLNNEQTKSLDMGIKNTAFGQNKSQRRNTSREEESKNASRFLARMLISGVVTQQAYDQQTTPELKLKYATALYEGRKKEKRAKETTEELDAIRPNDFKTKRDNINKEKIAEANFNIALLKVDGSMKTHLGNLLQASSIIDKQRATQNSVGLQAGTDAVSIAGMRYGSGTQQRLGNEMKRQEIYTKLGEEKTAITTDASSKSARMISENVLARTDSIYKTEGTPGKGVNQNVLYAKAWSEYAMGQTLAESRSKSKAGKPMSPMEILSSFTHNVEKSNAPEAIKSEVLAGTKDKELYAKLEELNRTTAEGIRTAEANAVSQISIQNQAYKGQIAILDEQRKGKMFGAAPDSRKEERDAERQLRKDKRGYERGDRFATKRYAQGLTNMFGDSLPDEVVAPVQAQLAKGNAINRARQFGIVSAGNNATAAGLRKTVGYLGANNLQDLDLARARTVFKGENKNVTAQGIAKGAGLGDMSPLIKANESLEKSTLTLDKTIQQLISTPLTFDMSEINYFKAAMEKAAKEITASNDAMVQEKKAQQAEIDKRKDKEESEAARKARERGPVTSDERPSTVEEILAPGYNPNNSFGGVAGNPEEDSSNLASIAKSLNRLIGITSSQKGLPPENLA